MKTKLVRGAGFRGVLDYAFGDGKGAEIVAGNLSGTDPRSLAAEFGAVRQLRPSCTRPVWHCSLSCPPGERLTDEQWRAVAEDMLKHMGLSGYPFIVVRHGDTDLDHVHIIVSRIGLDGTLWHGQFEVPNAIQATQKIERDHGLTLTPGLRDDDETAPEQRAVHAGVRGIGKSEVERAIRSEEGPARVKLQTIIDAVMDGDPLTVDAFLDQLEAAGVVVVPNVAKTGRLNGFSFEIDGVPFKGSQLGSAYTLKSLIGKGLTYDQDQHGAGLVARTDGIKSRIRAINSGEPAPVGPTARPAGDGPIDNLAEVRREPGGDGVDAGNSDGTAGESVVVGSEIDPGVIEQGGVVAGAGREISPDIDVAGDFSGDDGFDAAADRIADLAATDDPAPRPNDHESGPGLPLTPSQQVKARAWARQSAALGAPGYRITLTARRHNLKTFSLGKGRGEDGAEKLYSADEVTALIPYLSRQNLIGFDIYVTPVDPRQHFIVLDDTTLAKINAMRERGFTPALVQESSAGNVQAVFRVPRTDASQEQKAANAMMVKLNKEWGDPKISGVSHPFRMAGFANKKPGRGDVFTRIIEAAGVVCGKAADMLAGGIARLQELRRAPAAPLIEPAPPSPADSRFVAVRARERGLAVSKRWPINEDTLDYRTAVALIAEGVSDDEIAGAMLRNSPDLVVRHSKTTVYLRKTVSAAGKAQARPNDEPSPEGPQGPTFS